jgi:hypothetical protein
MLYARPILKGARRTSTRSYVSCKECTSRGRLYRDAVVVYDGSR